MLQEDVPFKREPQKLIFLANLIKYEILFWNIEYQISLQANFSSIVNIFRRLLNLIK